jgi:hypothetical protein
MTEESKSGTRWAVSGMGALFAGRKVAALGMFAKGLMALEEHWRQNHPDFDGGFAERWDEATKFYAATHTNKVNRWLHMAGIPLITAGAAGLLTLKPYRTAWSVAAGSFAVGWGLNIAGHMFFEKNQPAFKDDPLSFIAGPMWDLQQLFDKKKTKKAKDGADAAVNTIPQAAVS